MIQMPEDQAAAGRESILKVLEMLEECGDRSDKNMSQEVIDYLKETAKRSSSEDVEIIMAWMFVGAVADRAMNRVKMNLMVAELAEVIAMSIAGDDDMMEA